MTKAGIIRRVNLGNYEHYEFWIEATEATTKKEAQNLINLCMEAMNGIMTAIDKPKVSAEKLPWNVK